MDEGEFILHNTVPGTGTNSLRTVLQRDPSVIQYKRLRALTHGDVSLREIRNGKFAFHSHMLPDEIEPIKKYAKLSKYPILSSMRDPALILCSQEYRGWGLDMSMVDRLLVFIELSKEFETVTIPVDLWSKLGAEARVAKFVKAMEPFGLSKTTTTLYARSWEPENRSTNSRLRDYYHDGHLDWIEEEIPELWGQLKNALPVLRPFCEKLGYENLKWWE